MKIVSKTVKLEKANRGRKEAEKVNVTEKNKKEATPEGQAQKQPQNNIILDQNKLQYLREHGFVKFDKKAIRKELEDENHSKEYINNWLKKYKYCRLMSDGQKMFYSEEYLNLNSIEEIEASFLKIN